MAYDLHDKLVIAISSRALFNLEEENSIFDKEGLEAYYTHQLAHLDDPLSKGSAFRFVQNLLAINKKFDNKLIEVIILSRNNAATGLRIGRSIEHYALDIERTGWTAGTPVARYLEAFKVDLFLSAEHYLKKAANYKPADPGVVNLFRKIKKICKVYSF